MHMSKMGFVAAKMADHCRSQTQLVFGEELGKLTIGHGHK